MIWKTPLKRAKQMKLIKNFLKLLLFCFFLSACTTITSKKVSDKSLSPDISTPSQYAQVIGIYNSGILGYITSDGKVHWRFNLKKGKDIGSISYIIITDNKLKEYNILIEKYQILLLEKESYKIEKNAGVQPFIDEYNNELWKIDAQHVVYFGIMKDWERNNVPPDSLWSKMVQTIKEKI